MSTPPTDVVPAAEFATRVWNELAVCVDKFIAAWDRATDPPPLAEYVPNEAVAVRRLILSELIKVDLEHRWHGKRAPKVVEDYLAEFTELVDDGLAPTDLIYEEYHVRRQAGDTVEMLTYLERFPKQEKELRRLLGLEAPHVTTTLIAGPAKVPENLGDRIDDFDLLTELGRGAFASVYLARQRSMQRMVALKVSADKGAEPQTLAQMDHPNIVRVYDQRSLPDRRLRLLYMQYVPGGTLESVHKRIEKLPPTERTGRQFLKSIDQSLDERGESPPSDSSTREKLAGASWPEVVCWLGARISMALNHAHSCGVLHRDLKPANVLVAADGNPKLADFNISFSSKLDGATPAAYFGGSLAYMSPEQLEACNPSHDREPDSLDGRSDVFSLGIMLWELLTGNRPFPDEPPNANWSTMLDRMVERRRDGIEPERASRLPAGCPPGLKDAILKCLTPDAESRPEAARAARMFEICLQPRAQRLLHGTESWWRKIVDNFPTTIVVVLIVAVNVVLSVLNIMYNAKQIVEHFNRTAQEVFLFGQIPIINAVCYTLGISIILTVGWPVFTAVRLNPPAAPPGMLALARSRCLQLGDYLAGVIISLWVVSGIVLPFWLGVVQERSGDDVTPGLILHFFMSQCLCGLIATTMSYFILTFITVRYFYPRLLTRELAEHSEVSQLVRLTRRIWIYYLLAVAVPFLAALPLLFQFSPELKTFIIILIFLGLAGFVLAYFSDRAIRDDLAALAAVVNPAGLSLASTETTSDSFFSGSRR